MIHNQTLRRFAACMVAVTTGVAFGGSALLDLAAPIDRWDDGIPLGNGGAGALLWGGGGTLNVTLDRADFWHNVNAPSYLAPSFTWKTLIEVVASKDDERRNRLFPMRDKPTSTKLPGVRLVLKLGEGQTLKKFRLDGKSASATVTVATPGGDRDILAWFDDGDNLLSIRVPDGVAFVKKTFQNNASFDKLGGYPAPEISMDGDAAVYRRRRRVGADNRFDTDFEAGVRFRDAPATPDSAFWRKFNAVSSLSVPDAEMQRLYDLTMYLYGAGARRGNPPLALQGLWTADNGKLPPWHGDYHNDLNTEMTYWAAGPAGHVEVLEAFADFYIDRLPEFCAFCRKIFDVFKYIIPVDTESDHRHKIDVKELYPTVAEMVYFLNMGNVKNSTISNMSNDNRLVNSELIQHNDTRCLWTTPLIAYGYRAIKKANQELKKYLHTRAMYNS